MGNVRCLNNMLGKNGPLSTDIFQALGFFGLGTEGFSPMIVIKDVCRYD
jgi:hypothetical protein